MTTRVTTISGAKDDSDELREDALASAEDERDTEDEPDTEEEEAAESGAEEEHEVEVEYDPRPWPHRDIDD